MRCGQRRRPARAICLRARMWAECRARAGARLWWVTERWLGVAYGNVDGVPLRHPSGWHRIRLVRRPKCDRGGLPAVGVAGAEDGLAQGRRRCRAGRSGKDGRQRNRCNRDADHRGADGKAGERERGSHACNAGIDNSCDDIGGSCDDIGDGCDDIRNVEKHRDGVDCDAGDGRHGRGERIGQGRGGRVVLSDGAARPAKRLNQAANDRAVIGFAPSSRRGCRLQHQAHAAHRCAGEGRTQRDPPGVNSREPHSLVHCTTPRVCAVAPTEPPFATPVYACGADATLNNQQEELA